MIMSEFKSCRTFKVLVLSGLALICFGGTSTSGCRDDYPTDPEDSEELTLTVAGNETSSPHTFVSSSSSSSGNNNTHLTFCSAQPPPECILTCTNWLPNQLGLTPQFVIDGDCLSLSEVESRPGFRLLETGDEKATRIGFSCAVLSTSRCYHAGVDFSNSISVAQGSREVCSRGARGTASGGSLPPLSGGSSPFSSPAPPSPPTEVTEVITDQSENSTTTEGTFSPEATASLAGGLVVAAAVILLVLAIVFAVRWKRQGCSSMDDEEGSAKATAAATVSYSDLRTPVDQNADQSSVPFSIDEVGPPVGGVSSPSNQGEEPNPSSLQESDRDDPDGYCDP